MKRANYKFTIAAVVLSVLFILPSCGIQKRRYTKGFYIPGRAHVKKSKSETAEKTLTLALNQPAEIDSISLEIRPSEILIAKEESNELAILTKQEIDKVNGSTSIKTKQTVIPKFQIRSTYETASYTTDDEEDYREEQKYHHRKRVGFILLGGLIIPGIGLLFAVAGIILLITNGKKHSQYKREKDEENGIYKREHPLVMASIISAACTVFCGVGLIPAIIFSLIAKRIIKRNPDRFYGKERANRVLIACLITLVVLILFTILLVLAFSGWGWA